MSRYVLCSCLMACWASLASRNPTNPICRVRPSLQHNQHAHGGEVVRTPAVTRRACKPFTAPCAQDFDIRDLSNGGEVLP